MPEPCRTVVTFKSDAFNSTEARGHFINPGCFGDDAAKWLIARLRAAGLRTGDAPDQEDFGWTFNFIVEGAEYAFVLGYRPGDEDEEGDWTGWIERNRGLLASLLGGRMRGISRAAAEAVHSALRDAEEVCSLRWHHRTDFNFGQEELGRPAP
jgi:hypothetical protein